MHKKTYQFTQSYIILGSSFAESGNHQHFTDPDGDGGKQIFNLSTWRPMFGVEFLSIVFHF